MSERLPRVVFFEELEAWLRELPWWEEELKEAGGAKSGGSAAFGGGRGSGGTGSSMEYEAIRRAELGARVKLLREGISRLSDTMQEFVQVAYLAKTATMGHSVKATCDLLGVTRTDYMQMRERALLPIIVELYYRRIDPGPPFSYCDRDMVPKHRRSV